MTEMLYSRLLPAVLENIPAITLQPPWGTAIARWGKPWENRSWMPPRKLLGQRIGIHQGVVQLRRNGMVAGTSAMRWAIESLEGIDLAYMLPEGLSLADALAQVVADSRMLLGTVVLSDVAVVAKDHAVSQWRDPGRKLHLSAWMQTGSHAWHLTDFQPCTPIPMTGLQKLWKIDRRRLAA